MTNGGPRRPARAGWPALPPSWQPAARSAWRRFVDHQVPGRSAQMSFYFFLSIFPILQLWFYWTGIAILVGAEIDASLLQSRTPRAGRPDEFADPARRDGAVRL